MGIISDRNHIEGDKINSVQLRNTFLDYREISC